MVTVTMKRGEGGGAGEREGAPLVVGASWRTPLRMLVPEGDRQQAERRADPGRIRVVARCWRGVFEAPEELEDEAMFLLLRHQPTGQAIARPELVPGHAL